MMITLARADCAGVYQLWKDGRCIYVGQTVNIFNRIGAHWTKDFDEVRFESVAHMALRLNREEDLIAELQPELNIVGKTDGGLGDMRRRDRQARRIAFPSAKRPGRPATGFDRKAYQRQKAKERRDKAKAKD